MDRPALSQAPYGWLMRLPGFDGLRVPARFWMMALACLSVVAALAVNRLQGRSAADRRRTRRARDCSSTGGPGRSPCVAGAPDPAVAGRSGDAARSPRLRRHRMRRRFTSRRSTPSRSTTASAATSRRTTTRLRMLLDAADPRILDVLAADGPLGVVIDHAGDPDGRLRRFVLSYPGAAVERPSPTGAATGFRAAPRSPALPDRDGNAAADQVAQHVSQSAARRARARRRPADAVERRRAAAVGRSHRRARAATHVGQVVIELGGFVTDFPARLQIDVSRDGVVVGDGVDRKHGAARLLRRDRHPREVPLVFPLNRDGVRFIRLRQAGSARTTGASRSSTCSSVGRWSPVYTPDRSMRLSRNARAAGRRLPRISSPSPSAYTWPLPIRLNGVPHDLGDPLLTTWFLWWSGTQARPADRALVERPDVLPRHRRSRVFGAPARARADRGAADRADAASRSIGHNVAFIATFVLSALGAHFLAYTLTRRHDVSAVAAVAFAFAPYRLPQAPHIQVLASFWTPVCLAALHRYDQTARTRWAVLAAAAWVLQALSCGYYLFFLAVLVALWFLWFAAGRWPVRQIAVAAAAFAAGALLLAPFLRGYQVILRDTYGFKRSIGEIRFFSADVAGLLFASDELLAWGWVQVFQRAESNLFPGLTIVLLTVFALYRAHPFRTDAAGAAADARRAPRRSPALLVLLLVATAHPARVRRLAAHHRRGPAAVDRARRQAADAGAARGARGDGARCRECGRRSIAARCWRSICSPRSRCGCSRSGRIRPSWISRALYQAPYSWLMRLPGFDGLRVPARFWMMALVCLSVVGGARRRPAAGTRAAGGRRARRRRPADRRMAAPVPGPCRARASALAAGCRGAPRPSH